MKLSHLSYLKLSRHTISGEFLPHPSNFCLLFFAGTMFRSAKSRSRIFTSKYLVQTVYSWDDFLAGGLHPISWNWASPPPPRPASRFARAAADLPTREGSVSSRRLGSSQTKRSDIPHDASSAEYHRTWQRKFVHNQFVEGTQISNPTWYGAIRFYWGVLRSQLGWTHP